MIRHVAVCSILIAACAWRGPPAPPTVSAMVLGWRLVPGQSLTYNYTTTYTTHDQETVRVEQWTYLVLSQEGDGVSRLEATLTGFGAGLEREGASVEEALIADARSQERARMASQTVQVELSMDGEIRSVDAKRWADRVPHQMLGLRLPADPVAPGEGWADPADARPWADPLPPEIELVIEHSHTFESLEIRDGRLMARLSTRGALRPAEPPSDGSFTGIRLEGQTLWDVQAGRLTERTLEIRVGGDFTGEPGALRIEARLAR